MEGLTKEDVLALRLEIAELRREMAELRRELVAIEIQGVKGRTVEGTFASAAGGRGSEQKGVAAVAECEEAEATDVRCGNGNRDARPYEGNAAKDVVSTEQIMTEWLEGEDAWKSKEKR
ncbi:MAG: hypothetical protein J6B09_06595 [Clostridia bacterium]|nr:hypothetical protein [Clostridia bacterium]